MEKEEIARYEQFLLFPQCFQNLYVVDAYLKCISMEYRVDPLFENLKFEGLEEEAF